VLLKVSGRALAPLDAAQVIQGSAHEVKSASYLVVPATKHHAKSATAKKTLSSTAPRQYGV